MSGRQRWADVAKGACIALVVLWHVTRKDYLQLGWDLPLPVTGAWGAASEVLLPVRMPLFFLVSGLFAARWLDRPWPSVWSARVAPLLHLFVLWTSVHTLVLRLTPDFDTAVADGPRDLLVQLTVTPGNLWYLLALASYVVVARAARRWPTLLLGAALVVSAVAAAGLVATPGNRYGLLTNLVWFVLGTRLAVHGSVLGRLTRPGSAVTTVAVLAFAGAAAAWQALDADAWLGVRPVLGLLGVLAGTTVAAQVPRLARVGPALASLGRRTLPVYVLHLPLVALVHLGSAHLVTGRTQESLLVAATYPLVVTAVVLATCLALHRLLATVGAGWLFEAPWTLRSGRAGGRSARSATGREATVKGTTPR